ncbi:MAG: chloride channel protein [Acidimicrobiales bacterium]
MLTNVNSKSRTSRLLLRDLQARASAWIGQSSYGRKWLLLGSVIGVIAGLGAVAFYETLQFSNWFFLKVLAGYTVPTPIGEGFVRASSHFTRPWAIPVVACVGALLGAVLVFRVAPEAEGHGTDAAISAVHHNPRGIRFRTVIVKIIASALTIGSGGSGGREGPTGQISAGFGSLLARLLDLSPSDARIAVSSGIGSGIGSIFGAPLGGAVLATEIMYRDDFEVEALLPALIASIVGYSVWGSFEGFGPLFGFASNYHLENAFQLVWFAIIGVLGGLVGLLYAKGFYAMVALFKKLSLPRWARPALGGLIVGLIGLVIPQVLGTGYGWIQQGLGSQLLHIPLWIVLILPFARIATTGLSIGSGGSGGIFGPGMVIGAFVGAGVWRVLAPLNGSIGHDPAPYVIVGMMACFGSISRAPLAVMLMVSEMTGTLSMIVPAMVAVGLATLIVRRGDDTIYRSQLKSRSESPAHRILAGLPLLSVIPVSQAMVPVRCLLDDSMAPARAISAMLANNVTAAPIVDPDAKYIGVATYEALREKSESNETSNIAGSIDPSFAPLHTSVRLNVVLEILTATPQTWAPVIDDQRHVVGTIAISDIVRGYRRGLQATLREATALNGDQESLYVEVSENSTMDGKQLRGAGLPRGLLITLIERKLEIIQPTGDVVIQPRDRLTALGSREDLRKLNELASGVSS